MDSIRAKQILNSDELIRVMHDGTPVWIDDVMDDDTAQITIINEDRKDTVPVETLEESFLGHTYV